MDDEEDEGAALQWMAKDARAGAAIAYFDLLDQAAHCRGDIDCEPGLWTRGRAGGVEPWSSGLANSSSSSVRGHEDNLSAAGECRVYRVSFWKKLKAALDETEQCCGCLSTLTKGFDSMAQQSPPASSTLNSENGTAAPDTVDVVPGGGADGRSRRAGDEEAEATVRGVATSADLYGNDIQQARTHAQVIDPGGRSLPR